MKKLIIGILLGGLVGYALNTKSGKKLVTWARDKAQDQLNNLSDKIDEVTSKKEKQLI